MWEDHFTHGEHERVSGSDVIFSGYVSDVVTADTFTMHFVQVCMLIGFYLVLLLKELNHISSLSHCTVSRLRCRCPRRHGRRR